MIDVVVDYISDEVPGIVFDTLEEQQEFDELFKNLSRNIEAAKEFDKCNEYASYGALLYNLYYRPYDPINKFGDNKTFERLIDLAEGAIKYESHGQYDIDMDPACAAIEALMLSYLHIRYPNSDIVVNGVDIFIQKKRKNEK